MRKRILSAALLALAAGAAPAFGGAGAGGTTAPPLATAPASEPQYAVGLRVLELVDPTRTLRLHGGRLVPRTLTTIVRYPAQGPAGGTDLAGAQPASAAGPFPLIVFGHGFAVTPATYSLLLQSWARAGYVVAAPVFPLGNADAPGGPTEADLPNQPRDMSFVISSLDALDATPGDPFAGLLAPGRVAVAGQSDGAETALAAAYSRRARDPRIGAAVILSGAMMSGVGGYSFAPGRPPLLTAQGTRDDVNEPRFTYAFFARARRPKYLLRLLGAEHLPPYTHEQPQLGIVERVTLAFLDGYLKGAADAPARVRALGAVAGVSQLVSDP